MKNFLRSNWRWCLIALICIASLVLIFSVNSFFDTRVDAPIYAGQIMSFTNGSILSASPEVMLRLFKPLYGIIGGWIFHTTHPYNVILTLNIIFYIVLACATYKLLQLLNFSATESVIGTLWTITAYPVLKYGLALGTDISGWAFTALTLYVGLSALKKNSTALLVVASVIGFIGALSKETGVLGLIALCLLVAWRFRKQGIKMWVVKVVAVGLPAAVLYGILLALIAGHAPSFLGWFHTANQSYDSSNSYSLVKFLAVEASTFGLLWLILIYGKIAVLRSCVKRGKIAIENYDFYVVTFLATLPILVWPLFISRVLFIQFIWVIPLALYGYSYAHKRLQSTSVWYRNYLGIGMIILPIALNVGLFVMSSGGSLFDIIRL